MSKRIATILAGVALILGFITVTAAPAAATTTGCNSWSSVASTRSNELYAPEPGGGGLMTNPSGVGYRYQYLSTCNVVRINHVVFFSNYQPPPNWDDTYVVNASSINCWVQWVDSAGNVLYDEPHHVCWDHVDSSSFVTLASGLTAPSIYYNILWERGHTASNFSYQINSHA